MNLRGGRIDLLTSHALFLVAVYFLAAAINAWNELTGGTAVGCGLVLGLAALLGSEVMRLEAKASFRQTLWIRVPIVALVVIWFVAIAP